VGDDRTTEGLLSHRRPVSPGVSVTYGTLAVRPTQEPAPRSSGRSHCRRKWEAEGRWRRMPSIVVNDDLGRQPLERPALESAWCRSSSLVAHAGSNEVRLSSRCDVEIRDMSEIGDKR
jgi:hypothetical protein